MPQEKTTLRQTTRFMFNTAILALETLRVAAMHLVKPAGGFRPGTWLYRVEARGRARLEPRLRDYLSRRDARRAAEAASRTHSL